MDYIKQTWDNNSDFTPTRMNHMEDGIENAYNRDWTILANGVTSADISDTNYKEYIVIVVVSSVSPNLCYSFHLFRGANLISVPLKLIQGSWANQSYGTAIEINVNTSSIALSSAYVNGSNVAGNTKLYISGRYPQ